MKLFSTKKQAPHQNADLISLANLLNFLDRNVINEMYLSRNVENIDKMGTFVFILLFKEHI